MKASPFRPAGQKKRKLNPSEKQQVVNLKNAAFELMKLFPVGTRESSLAITKLEESVMWGEKAITAGAHEA